MFGKLGIAGVLGVLVMGVGVAVIASQNPIIAGGIALIVAGLGFVVYGLITNVLSRLGMGGGIP